MIHKRFGTEHNRFKNITPKYIYVASDTCKLISRSFQRTYGQERMNNYNLNSPFSVKIQSIS